MDRINTTTPFDDIPYATFFERIGIICLVAGIVVFFLTGIISQTSLFQSHEGPRATVSPLAAALSHYQHLFSFVVDRPELCLSGKSLSLEQERACGTFWSELQISAFFAAVPWFVVIIIFGMGRSVLRVFYLSARARCGSGAPAAKGIVTDPALAKGSFLTWIACVDAVSVQVDAKRQMVVYVSKSRDLPTPGTSLGVYASVELFGQTCVFAAPFAPHVAVIRGS